MLTLREELRLGVFEKRVLGPKRDEETEERRKLHMRSFIICTHPKISLGRSSKRG
jgi:hypothetical protein